MQGLMLQRAVKGHQIGAKRRDDPPAKHSKVYQVSAANWPRPPPSATMFAITFIWPQPGAGLRYHRPPSLADPNQFL